MNRRDSDSLPKTEAIGNRGSGLPDEGPYDHQDDYGAVELCGDCHWLVRCTKRDAKRILDSINPYTNIARSRYSKEAVRNAVRACGICTVRTEIRSGTEIACDDHFEPRE